MKTLPLRTPLKPNFVWSQPLEKLSLRLGN